MPPHRVFEITTHQGYKIRLVTSISGEFTLQPTQKLIEEDGLDTQLTLSVVVARNEAGRVAPAGPSAFDMSQITIEDSQEEPSPASPVETEQQQDVEAHMFRGVYCDPPAYAQGWAIHDEDDHRVASSSSIPVHRDIDTRSENRPPPSVRAKENLPPAEPVEDDAGYSSEEEVERSLRDIDILDLGDEEDEEGEEQYMHQEEDYMGISEGHILQPYFSEGLDSIFSSRQGTEERGGNSSAPAHVQQLRNDARPMRRLPKRASPLATTWTAPDAADASMAVDEESIEAGPSHSAGNAGVQFADGLSTIYEDDETSRVTYREPTSYDYEYHVSDFYDMTGRSLPPPEVESEYTAADRAFFAEKARREQKEAERVIREERARELAAKEASRARGAAQLAALEAALHLPDPDAPFVFDPSSVAESTPPPSPAAMHRPGTAPRRQGTTFTGQTTHGTTRRPFGVKYDGRADADSES
ncbi:hypothetical protein HDZ31DRAFT_61366 [Schizophyllum fasciatum]